MMAADTLPTPIAALRGNSGQMRAVGRPFAEPDETDNLIELDALRAEARAAENVLPFARFARDRIAALGDAQALTAQGIVVLHLERQARRGGGDAA